MFDDADEGLQEQQGLARLIIYLTPTTYIALHIPYAQPGT